jgi:hypothetical protein
MAVALKKEFSLKLADEVFLVVATLHQENPDAEDFTVQEILAKANELRLNGDVRPGFVTHVRQHCVANKAPNPGEYRMLYATGRARRRLMRSSDVWDRNRQGRMFPEIQDIGPQYFTLVAWARVRYNSYGPSNVYDALLALVGSGKRLWADESPDEYVARLRSDWD